MTLVGFGWRELDRLAMAVPWLLVQLLVAAARALGPIIRRFISLGLNRVWLKSGDVAYRQGEPASCLFVVISGRLRLVHEGVHAVTQRPEARRRRAVAGARAAHHRSPLFPNLPPPLNPSSRRPCRPFPNPLSFIPSLLNPFPHPHPQNPTKQPQVRIEEECGRGEAVGAIWTITGGAHDTSAVCVRDTELVRMSKAAFQVIASQARAVAARCLLLS